MPNKRQEAREKFKTLAAQVNADFNEKNPPTSPIRVDANKQATFDANKQAFYQAAYDYALEHYLAKEITRNPRWGKFDEALQEKRAKLAQLDAVSQVLTETQKEEHEILKTFLERVSKAEAEAKKAIENDPSQRTKYDTDPTFARLRPNFDEKNQPIIDVIGNSDAIKAYLEYKFKDKFVAEPAANGKPEVLRVPIDAKDVAAWKTFREEMHRDLASGIMNSAEFKKFQETARYRTQKPIADANGVDMGKDAPWDRFYKKIQIQTPGVTPSTPAAAGAAAEKQEEHAISALRMRGP